MKRYLMYFICGHSRMQTTMPALAPREGDVVRCTQCRCQTTIQTVILASGSREKAQ